MKHVDNLDTTNSLEVGDLSSMNRRELVTGFVTSFFTMGTQSVLAQESGKEREKPTISMEKFMEILNERSTYKKLDLDREGSKSIVNNLLLIRTILQKYYLTDDDLNKAFRELFRSNNITIEMVYALENTLFQKGYFFNTLNEKYGGALLQKGALGISKFNNDDITKQFFGESVADIEVPSMIINDIYFRPLGYVLSGGNYILLNKVNVHSAYKDYQEFMKNISNPVFGELLDMKTYFNRTIVNELCHAILAEKYNFSNRNNLPWREELGDNYIEGITNNHKIGEFLSDVVSFIGGSREQSFLLLLHKSIALNAEAYKLSSILLYKYIYKVLSKKTTKNPEIDFILKVLSGKNSKVQAKQFFHSILNNLNKEDIAQINKYIINDGQYFLSIIKKHAPKN